ncbi:hypothetical protein [Desulfotomaculum nigrificans]|uniref:hypothetical protein n=1 Tax=Desulfotomaculum nigrificans TaxID=1565 RepID=UPI0001FAE908|nr:hypothetical protein [Desulfotomaculum nigrificans]
MRHETVKYTGEPFVDAGVAVMEHHLGKPCEDFKPEDLEKAAKWLIKIYERKSLKGYLTIHFPNSGWCNATISKEKKAEYINKVLQAYNFEPISGRECVYCHRPAQFLADRQHIPMLTGASTIITSPGGVPGLPVCGYCLMAIQFYPLATLKCQGKPLFWWTPEPDLNYSLTGEYFREIEKLIDGGSDKFPNLSWPKTILIDTAQKVLASYGDDKPLADCIGLHVTNYGAGPDYHQYRLPKELLEFLKLVRVKDEAVRSAHTHIIETAWVKDKNNKKQAKSQGKETPSRRNKYFEALVEVFEQANWSEKTKEIVHNFYFHKKPETFQYNNFALCKLFLEKVAGMDKQRLETIKRIADQVTNTLIIGNNETKWLNSLFNHEHKFHEFMRYLIRVQKRLAEKGQVLSLDDILIMLDLSNEEDTVSKDFSLVRDLFLIRMLELVGKNRKDMLNELELTSDTETN